VLLTGASIVGNLLAPSLLTTHPLLLVALAPRSAYLAVAAGQVPFAAFVVVALLRLCAADPSHFLLGRLHGARAAAILDRRSRRHHDRAGDAVGDGVGPRRGTWVALWDRLGLVLVALSPTGKVLLLAGASRLSHRRVAMAAVVGTLGQVLFLYVAGRAVAGTVGSLAGVMADYAPVMVLATGAVMVGTALAGRRSLAPRWLGRRWLARRGEGAGQPALRPALAAISSSRRP